MLLVIHAHSHAHQPAESIRLLSMVDHIFHAQATELYKVQLTSCFSSRDI
jgi:hypothetical protein